MGIHYPGMKFFICFLSVMPCILWPLVSSIETSPVTGRKFRLSGMKEEATLPEAHSHEDKTSDRFLLSSKIMAMGIPGVLLLGCAFMCLCFQTKKKDIHSTDSQRDLNLSKSCCFWVVHQTKKKDIHSTDSQRDLNLMDSSSSFEVNSSLEKVSASSWRHAPPSPAPSRHPPPSPNPSRHPPPSPQYPISPKLNRFGSVHLNFSHIAKATHNFSSSFKIGEGGYGTVYKAQLPSGRWIAVKRAKKEHFDSAEFNSEIEILSKIEHRNLVKLMGYVDKGNERLIVTEYVSNGTLREHLDGNRDKVLDFSQRLEIAIDVAHGLTYLHLYAEKQIIHRDVKSSNILLAENYKAKVADFGFARVGPVDSDHTHISTKVKGTVGYLDPEYMKTYQLTPKSDVYSFGILLLEILTGRRPVEPKRPVDQRVTIRWAIHSYNEGDVLKLLDPLMNEPVDVELLKKMFCLAFQCAAPGRVDRPDMKTVGEQLWAIRMEYQSTKRA